MTRSFNRIALAALIGISASSAFAASSRVHHPRETQTTSEYRALSNAPDVQVQPALTPTEKVQYERTRTLSGY